jgi:tRNA-specific 2-thiouridylase
MAVLLQEGEHGIAAGQACVFYADASERARVLGGGWIASAGPGVGIALQSTVSALDPDRASVSIHAHE